MDWFLLIALGVIWGASYPFIKVGVAEIPPLSFVAARTVLATAILFFAALARRDRWPRFTLSAWWPLVGMGLFNGVIPYTLITWGETEISSGLASILTATMPMFTVLLAHAFTHDEKLTRLKLAGILVGFVGVAVIFAPELSEGVKLSFFGMLAVVAAAAAYAVAAIIAHRFIAGVSHVVTATGQFASAAVIMAPLSLAVDHPWGLTPSALALSALAALSVLGTAIAYLIYYGLIERTGATRTSLVTYIIPLSGLSIGALFLNERPSLFWIAGLVLIIAGVVLVNRQAAPEM